MLLPLITNGAEPDVLAESSPEIDVSAVNGQAIKAVFRKQPLFVRRLTPAEVQAAQRGQPRSLRDPQTLLERTKEGHEDMLITMGGAPTSAAFPSVPPRASEGRVRRLLLPLPRSHYDTAARIRKGPAPSNLEVPVYEFTSDTVVKVG